VVGGGTIGSLFAGHFGSVATSTVLTRRTEHADQLNAEGLRVSGKSDVHSDIIASTVPAELGDVDLVIIATKTTAVEASARVLQGHFPNAAVMTVQNGLGCEDVVARYGAWTVISSVTFMSGRRLSDSHVEYSSTATGWSWAAAAPASRWRRPSAPVTASGLKAKAFPDLLPAQ
jgi:2-dehydropantoate 2-reductase